MTHSDYRQKRSDIIHRFHGKVFLDGDKPNMTYVDDVMKAIDTLFLELIGQNEPLIGDSDQFKITENNKVVRNRVRSELRQIIGKDKS